MSFCIGGDCADGTKKKNHSPDPLLPEEHSGLASVLRQRGGAAPGLASVLRQRRGAAPTRHSQVREKALTSLLTAVKKD